MSRRTLLQTEGCHALFVTTNVCILTDGVMAWRSSILLSDMCGEVYRNLCTGDQCTCATLAKHGTKLEPEGVLVYPSCKYIVTSGVTSPIQTTYSAFSSR